MYNYEGWISVPCEIPFEVEAESEEEAKEMIYRECNDFLSRLDRKYDIQFGEESIVEFHSDKY